MDNISILNKNNCTGCRMCEQICPVNAIQMIENKEGFIEPLVDKEKCINCGLCAKRCPQLNNTKNERIQKIEVYAAKNKNIEEQEQSSSGGIFSTLANYILKNNGIVYGCAFNENLVAEHIGIDQKEDLYKLRGSKYVQSNTRNTFREVKEKLENGKSVLYSGTPCQIAGLKAFLGKEYEQLITVDLVCHGVPSPKLFKKYINWLEEKYKSNSVITGPNIFIADYNHKYTDVNLAIKGQGVLLKGCKLKIDIGDETWIGTNIVIVGTVSIGKHCVIGANSVVTKNIPDFSVAVGNPARIIKKYSEQSKEWIVVK